MNQDDKPPTDRPQPGTRRDAQTDGEAQPIDAVEGVALSAALGADRNTLTQSWNDTLASALKQPELLWRTGLALQAEWARIWFGQAEPAELPEDRRFASPEWQDHPFFRRLRQSYVAWTQALDSWLEASDLTGIERQRARFVLDAAKDVFAPVNQPFTPEALQALNESKGQSLARGMRNLADDLLHNHGYPAVADRNAFVVGQDVAASTGSVIFRNEVFELLQYQPLTESVRQTPLLYVFSQVNRFYLGDLTPDRSLVQTLLRAGIQVFAISWRNPGREHAHWNLDVYAKAVIDALAVVREVAGAEQADLIGLCAGGVTAAAAAGVLEARGDNSVGSLSLFVSILDNRPGDSDFTLFVTDQSVAAQKQAVRNNGMMRERDILEMFALLRLDESVFSFMRANYFRGEAPLKHPLLFWSMDYTRVPAEMQCDFIDLSHRNTLPKGELTVLGEPVNLAATRYPVYVMAGSTDHITPWRGCYHSVHLFGGEVTFVLTNQNHTQTISARADNRRLRYWMAENLPETPEAWQAQAAETPGDWRTHWLAWLAGHSDLKPAPKALGAADWPILGPAPGRYVTGK